MIHGYRSEDQQVLEEFDSNPHGDLEGFKTSVGEVTTDMVEMAWKLEF